MRDPDVFEWTDDDASPVVTVVTELDAVGAGWVNLDPVVDPNDLPAPQGALGAMFWRRGPAAPRATWVSARPPAWSSVGIHHGAAQRARAVLAEFGLEVPDGVRQRQDNARRGLVAEVSPDADRTAVVEWLVAAATALSTVPLTGRWRAEVHRR